MVLNITVNNVRMAAYFSWKVELSINLPKLAEQLWFRNRQGRFIITWHLNSISVNKPTQSISLTHDSFELSENLCVPELWVLLTSVPNRPSEVSMSVSEFRFFDRIYQQIRPYLERPLCRQVPFAPFILRNWPSAWNFKVIVLVCILENFDSKVRKFRLF